MHNIHLATIRKLSRLRLPGGFNSIRLILLFALVCATFATRVVQAQKAMRGRIVRVLTLEGKVVEGSLTQVGFTKHSNELRADINVNWLSLHRAAAASPREAERITADLAAVQGTDRTARDTAVAELTDIGLPALTPLLNAYKDRDLREPDALYRLFARLMPGYADVADRSLDLIRRNNGAAVRGPFQVDSIELRLADGSKTRLPLEDIRTLAVRQPKIEKTFELHALRHCTQIEFLDTGVIVGPQSRVEVSAEGFVRLSFGIDGWASDADGLKVPGPNYKTNLVDGFPFGAVVGKVGVAGPRFLVGRRLDKTGLGTGRLYLAVNDNAHWQNNIGSFRVKLRVSDAYDVGDAQ